MDMALVLTTVSDRQAARDMSHKMVAGRMAACASMVQVDSIYTWKDNMEETAEYLVLFKTTAGGADRLKKAIQESHPYETPEILQVPVSDANGPYLSWLAASVRPADSQDMA